MRLVFQTDHNSPRLSSIEAIRATNAKALRVRCTVALLQSTVMRFRVFGQNYGIAVAALYDRAHDGA
jgi:hypothetical protein